MSCSICFEPINRHDRATSETCQTCRNTYHCRCLRDWFAVCSDVLCVCDTIVHVPDLHRDASVASVAWTIAVWLLIIYIVGVCMCCAIAIGAVCRFASAIITDVYGSTDVSLFPNTISSHGLWCLMHWCHSQYVWLIQSLQTALLPRVID
jgi:hypothetical protein